MQEVIDRAKELEQMKKRNEIKIPDCFICMDTGIVLYKKKTDFGYDAEYAAHCTCAKGIQYRYEGKECKEKSEYRIPSIDEVMNPEEIQKENFYTWYKNNSSNPNIDEAIENWKKSKALDGFEPVNEKAPF